MANTNSKLVKLLYDIIGHPSAHTEKNLYQCNSVNMLIVLFSLCILIHTGEMVNKCMLCVVLTTLACYIITKIYKIHCNTNCSLIVFICTIDTEYDNKKTNYIALQQYTHTGEKPKLCNRCRKGFMIIYNTSPDTKYADNTHETINIGKIVYKSIILILTVTPLCRTICGYIGIFIGQIQKTKWN